MIIKTTARSRYNVDMGEFIEDANNVRSLTLINRMRFLNHVVSFLLEHLMIQIYFIESSYYEEIGQHELLQLDAN